MRRDVCSRAVACLLLGLALAGPSIARAEEPAEDTTAEAKARFRQGSEAFGQKRFVEAAMHFEAAAALRPHAVPLFTAALAWDTAGRPERAADAFARALELPGLDAKQTATAKERVEALERTLGVLALTVPAGWKVQLDTLTEVKVTGPARLHAAPGAHVLTLQPPGRPIERRDVSLEAGKATPLTLTEADLASSKKPEVATTPKVEAPPPPPPPPPPPKPAPEPLPLRTVGFVAAGAGGALILSGIILGTQANGAGTAYSAGPTREGYDHASGLQTWTTVSFVSGILLAGAGVTLVLLPLGKSEAKVAISPNSVTLGGTFQ
ncbi:MAG: hypothetical protein IPF92_00735 [Myxococcales bacterium]|nr:hypothetical protein [Myxococcales bacterium]MBL0193657.1 hypothetical protein [Myxococcales bacterium]HQY61488.1 hypothetical protein [Polyangiaceae bacterium]